jgi:pyruvate kinase
MKTRLDSPSLTLHRQQTAPADKATATQPPTPPSAAAGPGALLPAAVFEHGATSEPGSLLIEALLEKGQIAEALPRVAALLDRLEQTKLAPVGHEQVLAAMSQLHGLQHQLLGAVNKLSLSSDPQLKTTAFTLLHRVAGLQTSAFDEAVSRGNALNPEGRVLPWAVYKDTMKKPGLHDKDTRLAYFAEKAAEFIERGGSMSQLKGVTAETLKGYPSGRLLEFAVDAYDQPRITDAEVQPNPGHSLLAMGEDVLSAGTFRVYKDDKGDIESVVLGTFSGHFRATTESLKHMARHIVAAGIDPARVVLQGGEAGSARAKEILAREIGMSGADLQRSLTADDRAAARYNPFATGLAPAAIEPLVVETKGVRPSASAREVAAALEAMRQTSLAVLGDGAVLETMGEASALAGAIDTALRRAEGAGSPVAYQQAMSLLAFLTGSDAPSMDAGAKQVLTELATSWQGHTFGAGATDPADVFSARPADGRRARIVATMNPEATPEQVRGMLLAGMDVARYNPAHAKPEELKLAFALVRDEAAKLGRQITIHMDLPGPKLRLGKFDNPNDLKFNDVILKEGDTIQLTNSPQLGSPTRLPFELPSMGTDVKVGDRIFMNDGLVELRVKAMSTDDEGFAVADVHVVQGGKIWDRKGVNMPDSDISIPTITDEDKAILDVVAKDLDVIAVSFTRTAACILTAREELRKRGVDIPVISKIETPEGMRNMEAIAAVADGMMVPRGDLGVELGRENLPSAERAMNALGNRLGKPTMVATEVLMSMANGDGRASRGDIEGLFSAVYEQGAEAVMLGKETSFTGDPARVVREAAMVIARAEREMQERPFKDLPQAERQRDALLASGSPLGVRLRATLS